MKKKSKKDMARCAEVQKWSYLVTRIAFGLFFFFAGLPKLTALIGGTNPLAGLGVAIWLTWIVAIIEVVGGAFLVFGFMAKFSGALIAITMIVAIIMTQFSAFSAKDFFLHLVYVGVAMWLGTNQEKFLAIDKFVCKN